MKSVRVTLRSTRTHWSLHLRHCLLTYRACGRCPAVVLCQYIEADDRGWNPPSSLPLMQLVLQQFPAALPSLKSLWNPTTSYSSPCNLHLPATSVLFLLCFCSSGTGLPSSDWSEYFPAWKVKRVVWLLKILPTLSVTD